jgi:signal transduction histidine kinase
MGRPSSLHIVPALAVFLPCVLVCLIGYKWIDLEREAEARRGEEAAEAESERIRSQLITHLGDITSEISGSWRRLATGRPPFAPSPPLPEIVSSAFVFTPAGKLVYPDYQGAYLETTRTNESATAPVKAAALLSQGRLSLAAKRYREAESSARQILHCCANMRDEYGVSFALYAAAQIAAASKARGRLGADLPRLASQIVELLRGGQIGHPSDLQDITILAASVGDDSDATLLLSHAEEQARRIGDQIDAGARLEKWISGTILAGPRPADFSLHTFWTEGRPRLAGLHRADDRITAALFAPGPIASWAAAEAARAGYFEAELVQKGEYGGSAILRTPLLPEVPDFELLLRPRDADPATQRWRRRLFAASLAAAVLLVLAVGSLAFRDVSREVRLASLRSMFVSSVTHELKTPLTSIRLLAETLRSKRLSDPAAADQMLSAIVDESERLAQLVNNVLSFAQIEKGARPYSLAPIELTEAVSDVVRRFQCVLKQGGFRLHQESDGGPMPVLADAEALSQAMLNLLDNAVKYSGRSREILLGIYRRGKEIEIRVTDHGIGVPPSEQRRIFESYYRAPSAARETTGAGLGLALVRHFAEAHGGRATVASGPGGGSAFSLWLPLLENHGQDSDR